MRRVATTAVIATLVVTGAATAGAAPGGNGKGPRSTHVETVLTVADGVYGSSTPASITNVRDYTYVSASCSQNGERTLFTDSQFDASGNTTIQLGPTSWFVEGVGGADCVAEARAWDVDRQRWIQLADTTFHVADR